MVSYAIILYRDLLGTGFNSLATHSQRNQVSVFIILPFDRSDGKGSVSLFLDILFPSQICNDFIFQKWHVSKIPIELSTVFLGDVLDGDEFTQNFQFLRVWHDLDFGDGDGIEPVLHPIPHGGEKARSSNDEDSIQRLGVVCCGQG